MECIQEHFLLKPPHLPIAQPAVTNDALSTESQQYTHSTICQGNAAECACPEAQRLHPRKLGYLAVG